MTKYCFHVRVVDKKLILLGKSRRNHIKENISHVHDVRKKKPEVDEKPAEKSLAMKSTLYDSVKPKVTEHMKVTITAFSTCVDDLKLKAFQTILCSTCHGITAVIEGDYNGCYRTE